MGDVCSKIITLEAYSLHRNHLPKPLARDKKHEPPMDSNRRIDSVETISIIESYNRNIIINHSLGHYNGDSVLLSWAI